MCWSARYLFICFHNNIFLFFKLVTCISLWYVRNLLGQNTTYKYDFLLLTLPDVAYVCHYANHLCNSVKPRHNITNAWQKLQVAFKDRLCSFNNVYRLSGYTDTLVSLTLHLALNCRVFVLTICPFKYHHIYISRIWDKFILKTLW